MLIPKCNYLCIFDTVQKHVIETVQTSCSLQHVCRNITCYFVVRLCVFTMYILYTPLSTDNCEPAVKL